MTPDSRPDSSPKMPSGNSSPAMPIVVPELGVDSDASLRISSWFVEPGEQIVVGDLLVEMAIPGITCNVLAATTGRVLRLDRGLDDRIRTGDVIGWILPDSPPQRSTGPSTANAALPEKPGQNSAEKPPSEPSA